VVIGYTATYHMVSDAGGKVKLIFNGILGRRPAAAVGGWSQVIANFAFGIDSKLRLEKGGYELFRVKLPEIIQTLA
jgi:hypothetical protein